MHAVPRLRYWPASSVERIVLTAKERSLSQLVRILFVAVVGVRHVGASSPLMEKALDRIWACPAIPRGIPGGIRVFSAQGA